MELSNLQSVDDVVGEIMKIHRSLPARPSIDEVEAAETLIGNIEKEDQARLDAVARQTKATKVPEELFMILQEMQRNMIHYQSKEQKREAMKLLELEHIHTLFDDYIQRASDCVSSGSGNNKKTSYSNGSAPKVSSSASMASTAAASNKKAATSTPALHYSEKAPVRSKSGELFTTRDDSFVKKSKPSYYDDGIGKGIRVLQKPQIQDSTLKTANTLGQDGGQLSLIKLASLIEVSSKKGTQELNLQNKLMDQVEWLPDSIGKLSSLLSLNLSENRLLTLPTTIGGLSSLKKLDLHSNQISELPDTIGDLFNLISLDLSSNNISSIPSTLGKLIRLEELDVSSNRISVLPDSIGSLVCLKKLTVETNDLDELPHSIGNCSSLRELHVDYNRIRALPEAVGKISTLEVLTVRYNNIRQLPTTMSSLTNLKELNVSFNELESVPESLCFATNLVKLNIGNNFANLTHLPRSIGNLEMLEELDISNNQIRVLPDSFRMLSKLRVLRTDQNPLEVPPRNIAEKGAQAVVQYIDQLVENRNKPLPVKQKKSWVNICFFSRSNKRKRGSTDYVKSVA